MGGCPYGWGVGTVGVECRTADVTPLRLRDGDVGEPLG